MKKKAHSWSHVHYERRSSGPGWSTLMAYFDVQERWPICGVPVRLGGRAPKGTPVCKRCQKAKELGRNHAKGIPPTTTVHS